MADFREFYFLEFPFFQIISEFKDTAMAANDDVMAFVRHSMIDNKKNELKTAQGKHTIPFMMSIEFKVQDLE